MTVKIEEIKENYLLIAYDISDKDVRIEIHGKLRDLGADMHTQSVYYVPDTVMTRDYLENWASREFGGIDLRVFELSPKDEQSKRFFHNKYKRYIRDLVDEFKEIQKSVMEQIEDFEDDIANEKKTDLRGFHKKVEGIDIRFEELQSLINKFGNKDDLWNAQAIDAVNRRLKDRIENVKKMKLRVFSK